MQLPRPFRHLLGYQIYLDRYALKDLDRRVEKGRVVLADTSSDPYRAQLEVATVQDVHQGEQVTVRLWEDGQALTVPVDKLMIPTEPDVDMMWRRVAKAVASVEASEEARRFWEQEFLWLLSDFRGLPGGRIMAGAGAPAKLSLHNCYLIPFVPSPIAPGTGIDSRHGILHTLTIFSELLSRGGGVGINISALRPRGSLVYGVHGASSGSVSWAELFSQAVHLVQQGGTRRGAAMLILEDWHPDVEEFISAKTDFSRLTGFNISVGISRAFERAIQEDLDWDLVFPDYAAAKEAYDREWDGSLESWKAKGYPVKVYKTVRARDLWDKIARSAWASGEPGIVRLGYANSMSNSWYYAPLIGTNPCAEEMLPAWGICDLGHLNLPKFLTPQGDVDRQQMRRAIRAMVRLLDNVVDLTYYAHPSIAAQAKMERRVGLGTLGLGELLLRLGIRYGSPEALRFVDDLYRFIAREAYLASVDLAAEKGAFPAFEASKFLQSGFMQQMDEDVRDVIAANGIRNVTLLTQAPTGSTGTMAGTSTGIEPYYDWHYTRRGRFGQKTFWEPVYLELINPRPDPDHPDPLPPHWVTAKELSVEEHVRMLAAVQRWVDASVSKTLNAPSSATVEDLKKAYDLAISLGVKAIAIYRDRSRDTQVLESASPEKPAGHEEHPDLTRGQHALHPRRRPSRVRGFTEKIPTSSGKLYVTVNFDDDGRPIEILMTGGKQGGEIKAWAELAGRWGSLALAYGAPIEKMAHGARGIKGYQSFWYKPDYADSGVLLHSGPDAVGFVLESALEQKVGKPQAEQLPLPLPDAEPLSDSEPESSSASPGAEPVICPACGEALTAMDGCWLCRNCGYSKCG